jgi:hypothetical protein
MKHTIRYDDERYLLLQTINGYFTTEETKQFGPRYQKLLKGKPYRHLVVDLRNAGKMENRETRLETNKILNEAEITHVVFVGANAAQRMIAKVLMKLGSLNAESNFVKDLDEAYNWLNKRRT